MRSGMVVRRGWAVLSLAWVEVRCWVLVVAAAAGVTGLSLTGPLVGSAQADPSALQVPGDCSLASAINAANAGASVGPYSSGDPGCANPDGLHLVQVSGDYPLGGSLGIFDPSLVGPTIGGAPTALPEISADVTIEGDGTNTISWTSSTVAGYDQGTRLFAVASTGSLTLQDIQIKGFSIRGTRAEIGAGGPVYPGDAYGGAIYAEGPLTLDHVGLFGNSAAGGLLDPGNGTAQDPPAQNTSTLPWPGGSAYGGAVYATSTVTVDSSAFDGNSVTGTDSIPTSVAWSASNLQPSASGGAGLGADIAFGSAALADITNTVFELSSATGGNGNVGQQPAAQPNQPAGASGGCNSNNTALANGADGAPGLNGGDGEDGGSGGSAAGVIYGGSSVSIVNAAMLGSKAVSGRAGVGGPPGLGGNGGDGGNSAICTGVIPWQGTPGNGGAAGNNGQNWGSSGHRGNAVATVWADGPLSLINTTVANTTATVLPDVAIAGYDNDVDPPQADIPIAGQGGCLESSTTCGDSGTPNVGKGSPPPLPTYEADGAPGAVGAASVYASSGRADASWSTFLDNVASPTPDGHRVSPLQPIGVLLTPQLLTGATGNIGGSVIDQLALATAHPNGTLAHLRCPGLQAGPVPAVLGDPNPLDLVAGYNVVSTTQDEQVASAICLPDADGVPGYALSGVASLSTTPTVSNAVLVPGFLMVAYAPSGPSSPAVGVYPLTAAHPVCPSFAPLPLRQDITTDARQFLRSGSCDAGAEQLDGISPTTPCYPGTDSQTGLVPCTPAPAGSYDPGTGNTSPTLCPAGRYSGRTGAGACTPAPAGSYDPGTGDTAPTLCAAGTYSASTGASACTPAPAGSYAAGTGNTAPTTCPTGTSNTGTGNTFCTATTSLTYGGPDTVAISSSFTPSATLTSAARCENHQPVAFSLSADPLTGTAGPYLLETVDTTTNGGADGALVKTSDWKNGVYTLTTSYAGTSTGDIRCAAATTTASFAVTAPQSIAFPAPAAGTVGGSEPLSATGGDSGKPVVFTVDMTNSSPSDACSLSPDGTRVDFAHAGSCVIDANQDGSSDYTAAPQVSQAITVGQATPAVVVVVDPVPGATVATSVSLKATVVGVAGGSTPTGTVSFAVSGGSVSGCSSVALAGGLASCTLGTLPAGTYTFTATYSGDNDYVTGSPDIESGYSVTKLPTIGSAALPAGSGTLPAPVFGEPLAISVTFTSGGLPVSGGSVQWSVGGNAVGAPVSVGSDGSATSPTLNNLSPGSHTVTASYSGTGTAAPSSQSFQVVVSQAATTTKLSVGAAQLTATVAPVPPGGGTPAGTVTFYVGSKDVGTSTLSNSGVATLSYTSKGAESVSATYGGDSSFTGSSASTATINPKITATVHSSRHKRRSGWYTGPVTVTFECVAGSSPLLGGCPGPVVLSHNGRAQSVTRTIHAADGGVATVVVSPINIDRDAPRLTVLGVHDGGVYLMPGPNPVCSVRQGVSGLARRCRLTLAHHGSVVRYRATAVSNAGVRATVAGSYQLVSYLVVGAPLTNGRFTVQAGSTYTLEAFVPSRSTQAAPLVYEYAAPLDGSPGPGLAAMQQIGHGVWAIRVTISRQMAEHQDWTLGVSLDGVLHPIAILVLPAKAR